MKKIWKYSIVKLVAISMLSILSQSGKVHGQITLVGQIDSSAYPALWRMVQISPTETKYFFTDTVNNTFSLLNMDFTPFLTNISVPDPWAWTTIGYQAYYITRDLFDCDTSNIEFVYAAPNTDKKPFRVLRTDGTLLFQLDSAIAFFCFGACGDGGSDIIPPIINTSAGARLVLTKFNSGNEVDYIYSLCGTVPNEIFDFTTTTQSYVRIFPNPTSGLLTFKINLPDNMSKYELVILDSNGREVRREMVSAMNHLYSIDVKDLSSGSYFYSLSTKSKLYQNGKFIINK